MKATPFKNGIDIAPILFEEEICKKAFEMRKAGLRWQHHVGCFVWDREDSIRVPSPFPLNIYFILNLNHFLRIFHSIENLKNKLVWLPTWHQCLLIIEQLGIDNKMILEKLSNQNSLFGSRGISILYDIIIEKFKKNF